MKTISGRIWASGILVASAAAADVWVFCQQRQRESMSAVVVVLSVMGYELLVKCVQPAYPTT